MRRVEDYPSVYKAEIDTRTENQFINQVVLIHTQNQRARAVSYATVLNQKWLCVIFVSHVTVIPGHDIMALSGYSKTTGVRGLYKRQGNYSSAPTYMPYPVPVGKIICFTICFWGILLSNYNITLLQRSVCWIEPYKDIYVLLHPLVIIAFQLSLLLLIICLPVQLYLVSCGWRYNLFPPRRNSLVVW